MRQPLATKTPLLILYDPTLLRDFNINYERKCILMIILHSVIAIAIQTTKRSDGSIAKKLELLTKLIIIIYVVCQGRTFNCCMYDITVVNLGDGICTSFYN